MRSYGLALITVNATITAMAVALTSVLGLPGVAARAGPK